MSSSQAKSWHAAARNLKGYTASIDRCFSFIFADMSMKCLYHRNIYLHCDSLSILIVLLSKQSILTWNIMELQGSSRPKGAEHDRG